MDEQGELYQYLYDLQGYLVIEDVLTSDQVAELNVLIDEHVPSPGKAITSAERCSTNIARPS